MEIGREDKFYLQKEALLRDLHYQMIGGVKPEESNAFLKDIVKYYDHYTTNIGTDDKKDDNEKKELQKALTDIMRHLKKESSDINKIDIDTINNLIDDLIKSKNCDEDKQQIANLELRVGEELREKAERELSMKTEITNVKNEKSKEIEAKKEALDAKIKCDGELATAKIELVDCKEELRNIKEKIPDYENINTELKEAKAELVAAKALVEKKNVELKATAEAKKICDDKLAAAINLQKEALITRQEEIKRRIEEINKKKEAAAKEAAAKEAAATAAAT